MRTREQTMEFSPKAVFFVGPKTDLNARVHGGVARIVADLPIYDYFLFYPDSHKLTEMKEREVSTKVSYLRGKETIQLPGETTEKPLTMVNIVLAIDCDDGAVTQTLERVSSLTRFSDSERPNLTILLTNRKYAITDRQIILDWQLEGGQVMKEDEYVSCCVRVITALLLMPTDDDLVNHFFGKSSRVCANVEITRIPDDSERTALTRHFRTVLQQKIEHDEARIPIEFNYFKLLIDSDNGTRDRAAAAQDSRELQAANLHIQIPLFASSAGRVKFVNNRRSAFLEEKRRFAETLLLRTRSWREDIWRGPGALGLDSQIHSKIQEALKTYRLGALKKQLSILSQNVLREISEPALWHFLKESPSITITGFPFSRLWLVCFLVLIGLCVSVGFFLREFPAATLAYAIPILYWPILLCRAFFQLKQKSLSIESSMRGDFSKAQTFVTENSKNFEQARRNLLLSILLRMTERYDKMIDKILDRIRTREGVVTDGEKREFQQIKAKVGKEWDTIEAEMKKGAASALDRALEKLGSAILSEADASEMVFDETWREFRNQEQYEEIVKVFLEKAIPTLSSGFATVERLPCGTEVVAQDPQVRSRFILSPLKTFEKLRKDGNGQVQTIPIPADDIWLFVHVAPVA